MLSVLFLSTVMLVVSLLCVIILIVLLLSIIMLDAVCTENYYADCSSAECMLNAVYAECHYANFWVFLC